MKVYKTEEIRNIAIVGGAGFQLPADLNMANGYVVRLTDNNGNICSKAFIMLLYPVLFSSV